MLGMGSDACGELSMMFVVLLRTVGIPARHCLMNWRYAGEGLHYYCEYWDAQANEWIPLDASDEKKIPPPVSARERSRTMRAGTLTFYAHPGFPDDRDMYDTACLEECLPVTSNLFEVRDVEFQTPSGFAGLATACVWNSDAWHPMARGSVGTSPARPMQFATAEEPAERPVLFTATDGKKLFRALQAPPADAGRVDLKMAVPDECLRATGYVKP